MPKFANGTLAELRLLRRLDAELDGYPFSGVNIGLGPWAPSNESATLYKFNIRKNAANVLRYCVDAGLLERVSAATASQIRTFLANRGISVTLTEANRLKTIAANAVDDDDDQLADVE
jgi:hypothetical protein